MFRLLPRSAVSRIVVVLSITAAAVLTSVGVSAVEGGAAAAGSSSPLGVYVGYQSPGGVSSFGRAIGQQPAFAMDFLDGDSWSALVNTAPSYMAAWKGSGYTMIWGLPMLPGGGASLAQGATGAYNSYFLQLAQDMVASGQGGSIIRPGWEFNGGWFPWAANGHAAAYVAYWQQIVDTMRSVPGQSFTFEWNPTAGDLGVGNLADYYPGSAYVDYIGLDLYDQNWATYPGITSQWKSYLTEPYGLDWLASFAAAEGKQITLPEWGLSPDPSSNDGGVASASNAQVGGGDDPTFINDVAQWISQNHVYEATYWQFNSSYLSSSSNPNSFAAFVHDFGSGSTFPVATTTTPTTSTAGSTSSSSSSGTGGAGSETSSSGASTPSLPVTFPTSSETNSTVTIDSPPSGLLTSRSAHFAAEVSVGASGTGTANPSGTVTWGIRSRFGSNVSCSSGSTVVRRNNGMTRCNVGPGQLSAADGPYTVSVSYPGAPGVAASSASVTQPVGKAGSRIRIRTFSVVPSGGSATITAAVLGVPASAGTPTGTVTFSLVGASGRSLACVGGDIAPVTSGVATCATAPAASADSPYVVTATYSGDTTFDGSTSNTRTIRVR